MERATLVDGGLALVFVTFALYFALEVGPLAAAIWALVAVAFGARAAGLLPT